MHHQVFTVLCTSVHVQALAALTATLAPQTEEDPKKKKKGGAEFRQAGHATQRVCITLAGAPAPCCVPDFTACPRQPLIPLLSYLVVFLPCNPLCF